MRKICRRFCFVISICLSLTGFAEEKYVIDNAHAEIGFLVDHMIINKVRGKFVDFDGFLMLDDNGKLTDAEVNIRNPAPNPNWHAHGL